MSAIRAGLERYLTQAPHRKAFSILRDKVFVPANEALDSHLKSLAKTGLLSSTKHKQALEREDVEQLFTAKSCSDCLVLSNALLWQARRRKPEKYGKERYCFRKNRKRPGIYCPSRASHKRSSWRPQRQPRRLASHNV